MAAYPDSTRAFVPREDKVDINAADDINDLQQEVVAIQQTLGRNPHRSVQHPGAETVSARLALIEQEYDDRLDDIEPRLRRASVSAELSSTRQFNHSYDWQPLALPDITALLNDFPSTLYDRELGRFYSVAPSPGLWAISASVTWAARPDAQGTRGLAVRTMGGTLLAVEQRQALQQEDQTLTVSWVGRLTEDVNFYLDLVVRQTQGTAVDLRPNGATTPCRVDFTHLVG